MKIDHETIDNMIENNHHVEIAKYSNLKFSITNYGIYSDEGFICFTGSNIINADNICDKLRRLYPNKKFYIAEEFMGFS